MREKAGMTRQVSARKANVSEPPRECRKRRDVTGTGIRSLAREELGRRPADGSSGDRHEGGASLAQALVWNVGTSRPDGKGDLQAADPRGAEYRSGAKGRIGSW